VLLVVEIVIGLSPVLLVEEIVIALPPVCFWRWR